MEVIGIIVEYNPFHNGHLYHINKIKEMYPNSIIIAVISSAFLQRGEISILNKWDKTSICLNNNIDLVIELPFVFSSQSADIFAKGAINILNHLKVNKIVFGSEINDIKELEKEALKLLNNEKNTLIKKYLDKGLNYPSAMAKLTNNIINTPNDILGIAYVKEILKNKYNINPITIKRTNNYHSKDTNTDIISATAIRNLIKEKKDISKYVPKEVIKYIYKEITFFNYLKYKINSDGKRLSIYQTVDEGIENRILDYINTSNNIEELIKNIKTKRYTYNKINRMFIHILTSLEKEEVKDLKTEYIRILGFNKKGKAYLNTIKKEINIPLITSYKNNNYKNLNIEKRITAIYSLLVNDKTIIKKELQKPIIK